MKFSFASLKKILRVLHPTIEIGGLEIEDAALLYCSINPETKKIKRYSEPISPGVISGGKVVDADKFITALQHLHKRITSKDDSPITVIAVISDVNVYTQTFSMPLLEGSNKEEATSLNIEVVSPLELDEAYYGWQYRPYEEQDKQQKVVASFIEKKIVDSLQASLDKAGFSVVAIEQKAAALTRVVIEDAKVYDESSLFMLSVDQDGVSFSAVGGGMLQFNRYVSWTEINKQVGGSKQISFKDFRDLIVRESQRVINYYAGHEKKQPHILYLVAPRMEEKLRGILEQEFDLRIHTVNAKKHGIEQAWLVAFGGAMRGLMPRANDGFISLAPEGTVAKFVHTQILTFIRLWRAVLSTVFVVILVACVAVFAFLQNHIDTLSKDLASLSGTQNIALLNTLTTEAKNFNTAVSRALQVKGGQIHVSGLINDIYSATGSTLISRLYIPFGDNASTINASASNEQEALAFKNRLEQLPQLTKVDLPLAAITPAPGGRVVFRISFNINPATLK